MSEGLSPMRSPSGPGSTGLPSITYSGALGPVNDAAPRIRIDRPPLEVRSTVTPGNRPSSVFSTDSVGVSRTSRAVTVWPVLLLSGAGAFVRLPPPPLEQAATTSRVLQSRARD